MTMQDERKIAWVTGAGKGIGRAVAKRLADEGWTVAVSARTEKDLSDLAAECPDGRIHPFPLDVTDLGKTEAVVAEIERALGTPDMVVFNAGTHIPVSADSFDVEPFRRLVETNLMGTVNGLGQIVPRFVERGHGHIAVVASVAGYRGLPSSAAYGATKAGLINMCEALKPELERHGVRISLINPGFVETPLTDKNDFPMPFLISVDEASAHIVRGLSSSRFETAFPRRFAFFMKLLRLLPDRLFFFVSRRMVRE
jgi:NAD(P)-dependent dehydrogenase (short-subunit alcohol dehydrogenase family)